MVSAQIFTKKKDDLDHKSNNINWAFETVDLQEISVHLVTVCTV